MHPLGIYISVPFCRAKCSFCNFASDAFALDRIDAYIERLTGEVGAARSDAALINATLSNTVDTVYLGGGTPSLLSPDQLRRIFAALRGQFTFAPKAEITLESAPGQIAAETLDAAVAVGVNRVSFGVQSFVDAETSAVGRLHTAAVCLEEIARVRAVGVEAISLDLIAGLPGQSAASWEHSLDALIDSGVPHASVYMLEVDDDSRLGRELIGGGRRYGAALVPTDEAVADFYTRACERLAAAGLPQYEISNFARPGHESRHNLKYWAREPYLGFGVDAHSMLHTPSGVVRMANPDTLEDYGSNLPATVTHVDRDGAFEEALFLGLRTNSGISLSTVEAEFGSGRLGVTMPAIAELIEGGLLEDEGDRLRLTPRGRLISNSVFTELLSPQLA